MPWTIIKKNEIDPWNEKLKSYNAELYQYPYYLTGEYSSLFYHNRFIKYIFNGEEIAFAAIVEIGILPFKACIIDDGPVIFSDTISPGILLQELKDFAKRNFYMHLQIRPTSTLFENFLSADEDFDTELYFPFHRKEQADWNIYNQPEEKLWASFKGQCRRKIVLAGRVPFEFCKLEEKDLHKVRSLFKQVAKIKGYRFIAFKALKRMYKNGKKHNLCDLYGAYLNRELVNVILIIKDTKCFYHFTSAMLVKGYKYNESPSAKLHYFLMKDCFYHEHKAYYNISYGGTDNLMRFKELFHPVEVKKPLYYTCIFNKKALALFKKTTPENTLKLRFFIKNLSKYIKQLYQ